MSVIPLHKQFNFTGQNWLYIVHELCVLVFNLRTKTKVDCSSNTILSKLQMSALWLEFMVFIVALKIRLSSKWMQNKIFGKLYSTLFMHCTC